MEICDFFEGIEDNSAFSFTIDDSGRFVPVKEPSYSIYAAEMYPFDIFENEMYAVNQYCCEVAQIVRRNYAAAKERLAYHRETEKEVGADGMCTKYELIMGAQSNVYMWQTIIENTACHLIVLVYSFLERALHKVFLLMQEDAGASTYPKEKNSRVKIYRYLESIFGVDADVLFQASPRYMEILEDARRIRNRAMHGSFLHNDQNDDYDEIRTNPSFRLIELLDTVSYILWMTEREYQSSWED